MARWDRRTRLTTEMRWRDHTKPGLQSTTRGVSAFFSGVSREAAGASNAVSQSLSGSMGVAFGLMGAAVLGFAGKAVHAFAEVELKTVQLFGLMRRESEQTKNKIFDDLEAISLRIGQPMTLVLDTAFQARSAGAAPDQLGQIVEMSHLAGLGARGDPATIAKLLQGSINVFDRPALDAMNVWLATAEGGVTTLGELAQQMGPVNQMASDVGVSLEHTGSAMRALTGATLNTSVASTQLMGLLRELSREGTKGSKFFQEVAGETFPEYIARTNDFAGAMKLMGDAASEQGILWANVFQEQQAGLAAATLATQDYFDTHEDFMKSVPGAYDELAAAVRNTTAVELGQAQALRDGFMRNAGETLSLWFKQGVEAVRGYLSAQGVNTKKSALTMQEIYVQVIDNLKGAWADFRASQVSELRNERSAWQEHYGAIARMDAAFAAQRLANLRLRSGRTPQVLNPMMQSVTGYVTSVPAIDYSYIYGTPLDPNFGDDTGGGGGGGGRTDNTLSDIAVSNREILESLRTGQALVVQLDAQVDEGIILRADTVQRSSRQIAARLGNVMAERTRSG